ncbi:MAG TPA: hypothetical protein VGW34_01380 [Allosphingosinicella sp.]|nr:hypothetical protein [Allosphingosinicella sp.]
MRVSIFLLAIAGLLPAPPETSASSVPRRKDAPELESLSARVREIAFNPNTFFKQETLLEPLISITYTGDDWGWPVYAIALHEGCVRPEPVGPRCWYRRTARMMRVHGLASHERPRTAGRLLIDRIDAKAPRTDEEIKTVLDGSELDWLQADLNACPRAAALISKTKNMDWVGSEIHSPVRGGPITYAVHADDTMIHLRSSIQQVSMFSGLPRGNNPAAWAKKFYQALQPCLKPASAPWPWRQKSDEE